MDGEGWCAGRGRGAAGTTPHGALREHAVLPAVVQHVRGLQLLRGFQLLRHQVPPLRSAAGAVTRHLLGSATSTVGTRIPKPNIPSICELLPHKLVCLMLK